jgi:hypothetical protein
MVRTPRPAHHLNLENPLQRRSDRNEPEPDRNHPKSATTPPADGAPEPEEPSEIKRQLTDDEIAAIAAGGTPSKLLL